MKIIAHRGVSEHFPENTLIAITKAMEAGVDAIETDIRLSDDGIAFLYHDKSLKDLIGKGRGLENEHSSYIETLDAGSWFNTSYAHLRLPTLDQLLEHVNGHTTLILELKSHKKTYKDIAKVVSQAIKDKLLWCEISSFDDRILSYAHNINPEIRLHKLIHKKKTLEYPDFDTRYAFASYFDIKVKLRNHPKCIELIKTKKVILWTVGDEDISSSIALGLYGAMSNDPVHLAKKYPPTS